MQRQTGTKIVAAVYRFVAFRDLQLNTYIVTRSIICTLAGYSETPVSTHLNAIKTEMIVLLAVEVRSAVTVTCLVKVELSLHTP